MNTAQTAQPIYSWIRGVEIAYPELGKVLLSLSDPRWEWKSMEEKMSFVESHSFAFTPEGRYLSIYRDSGVESGCVPCVGV